jgi:signal transduction histidine kinase/ActR/RegA family two-component response regulator
MWPVVLPLVRLRPGGPRLSLRAHLVWLVLVALLPPLFFATTLVVTITRQERAAVEQGLRETVRAMAQTVEREIVGSIEALQVLAISPHLEAGDLAGFYRQATVAARGHEEWATVILVDRSGRQRVNLARPLGAALPYVGDRPYVREVMQTERPTVSDVLTDRTTGALIVAIGVPVWIDGALRYVLAAALTPEPWASILAAQRVADDRIASVIDREGTYLARTRNPERFVGQPTAEPLGRAIVASPDGLRRLPVADGGDVYAAWKRVPRSGWTVVIGGPADRVDASLRRSLAVAAGGGVLLVLVGIGLATILGQRIAAPIESLSRAATAIGRGESPPALPASSVVEVVALGHAVDEAGRLLREREASLVAAGRAKDDFLAVLSHELRTPLTAMLGWVRVLRSGRLPADQTARALESIERSTRVQAQLIDDLLDVSRFIAGKLRLETQPLDLVAVVEEGVEALRSKAEARRVTLDVVVAPTGPVLGDPVRLHQVVVNLVDNAVNFTPAGGRVTVRLVETGGQARIAVTDTGAGIDPALLPRMFDRFLQADSSTTRGHAGLGLGLAIVRHLVELHGGTVAAASEGPGRGATLTVTLPLTARRPTGDRGRPGHHRAPEPGDRPLDELRLLVVDDRPEARELLTTVLAAAGAEVAVAASAEEALGRLEAAPVDALVSDVGMPDVDGYELIRRVRERERARGTRRPLPAVAVTAYASAEDRERALAAGFHAWAAKPLDPASLVDLVAKVASGA